MHRVEILLKSGPMVGWAGHWRAESIALPT